MATALPVYLVIDESDAMQACGDELAAGLAALRDRLRSDPAMASLRLTVLGMAESTRVRLEAEAASGSQVPVPGGQANFAAAFADLLARIPADAAWLEASGQQVQRPVVFFLAGAQPDPGPAAPVWQIRQQLTDQRVTAAAPVIVACAFASRPDMAPHAAWAAQVLATQPTFAFSAEPGMAPGPAVTAFFGALGENLAATAALVGSPVPQIVTAAPPGFTPALPPPPSAFPTPVGPPPAGAFPVPAPPGAPGPRSRRRLAIGAIGAVAVAALVTGVLVAVSGGQPVPLAAQPQAKPFTAALAALAAEPMARYQATIGGVGAADVRVTPNDEMIGTVTQDGDTINLLVADGQVYVKLPSSDLSGTGNSLQEKVMAGKWLTGSDMTSVVGNIQSDFQTPLSLAATLAGELSAGTDTGSGSGTASPAATATLPSAGSQGTLLDGVRVLKATTPSGDIYVTKDQPYRVVSVVPATHTASSPASTAPGTASFVRPLAEQADTGSIQLPQETPSDTASEYQTLESDTKHLGQAINTDLSFDLEGKANVSCGSSGCTASATVTSNGSDSAATGGDVTGYMMADLTIGGKPAGSCSNTGSLPLNGTGTISCNDPAGGPVFDSVKSKKEAAALNESEAEGGAVVTYDIPYEVESYVYAAAQVNTSGLVSEERAEGQNGSTTQHLTSTQAAGLARYLGYHPANAVSSNGQRVFTNGTTYISQDVTSHMGGTWKIAGSVKDLGGTTAQTATTGALLTKVGAGDQA